MIEGFLDTPIASDRNLCAQYLRLCMSDCLIDDVLKLLAPACIDTVQARSRHRRELLRVDVGWSNATEAEEWDAEICPRFGAADAGDGQSPQRWPFRPRTQNEKDSRARTRNQEHVLAAQEIKNTSGATRRGGSAPPSPTRGWVVK